MSSITERFPCNVGIVAVELYFPPHYVDQAELELHDQVQPGKYTKGLGQKRMGFCTELEDVHSLCLTAVSRLMARQSLDFEQIGRLEVGTETLVDKSKSVKSVLMQLFKNNNDVEGVDNTNACYGGTAALFNCVDWIESSAWDGRYALAVCADVAVYPSGPARPTGGAGACVMLVGANAALILDRGLRASHSEHSYDFYKPFLASDYPIVDGQLSIKCYLKALVKSYERYCEKREKRGGDVTSLSSFDGVVFHTPFCKIVHKALATLNLVDHVRLGSASTLLTQNTDLSKLEDLCGNRMLMQELMEKSSNLFAEKTMPSLLVASQVGNLYTPSLYGGLVSYLINVVEEHYERAKGLRIGLFAYGSGLMASFFSVQVTRDADSIQRLMSGLVDVRSRLEHRVRVSPSSFTAIMERRECINARLNNKDVKERFVPEGNTDDLFPHTWYLSHVDEQRRRFYVSNEDISDKDFVIINGHG